ILPFANYVGSVRLSGDALRAMLEHSVGSLDSRAGRFLQVSGLRFRFDPDAPPGSRVRDVWVGEAPLDPAARYTVALNDFLEQGGDDYALLRDAEWFVPSQTGPMLANLWPQYVAARGPIAPTVEGGIEAIPPP